jgi:hypothetical protein
MKTKTINAIIKNERGEVCHRINDVVQMALGRNEHIADTKKYIIQNYKDYTVEFEVK